MVVLKKEGVTGRFIFSREGRMIRDPKYKWKFGLK